MVGSWFTQGRLVCRCSHSLRVVPLSCWLNCCCCSGKLLGVWVWWEGCCSKLSPWRDEKHSEALNANAVEQVRAARTMAAIELCRRKLALVSQLSTCHCYCQREGDERNRLQQQKIQFIKKKNQPNQTTTTTKQSWGIASIKCTLQSCLEEKMWHVGEKWGHCGEKGKINTNVAVAKFCVLHAITKCSSSPYVL